MSVISRNFFRLLRSGAFEDYIPLEPMSHWKWDQLYQLSLMHGVTALVYDGMKAHYDDFYLQLLEKQQTVWQNTVNEIESNNTRLNNTIAELFAILNTNRLRPILLKGQGISMIYNQPLHRTGGNIDIFFPYIPQARKANEWAIKNGEDIDKSERYQLEYKWKDIDIKHHLRMQSLTNVFLNRKLQKIIESEIRCCDSSFVYISDCKIEVVPPTLNLLLIMMRITRYILNEGISLKQLVDLGTFLRKSGDKVDFVKIQQWIEDLKMQRIAQLEALLLIEIFGFSEDEIPFIQPQVRLNISPVKQDILNLKSTHHEEWYFTQGKNIFVGTSNSSAMFWHLRHSAKYAGYYPSESATNVVASFIHSLSHIEE